MRSAARRARRASGACTARRWRHWTWREGCSACSGDRSPATSWDLASSPGPMRRLLRGSRRCRSWWTRLPTRPAALRTWRRLCGRWGQRWPGWRRLPSRRGGWRSRRCRTPQPRGRLQMPPPGRRGAAGRAARPGRDQPVARRARLARVGSERGSQRRAPRRQHKGRPPPRRPRPTGQRRSGGQRAAAEAARPLTCRARPPSAQPAL
mmetsp:Transcript_23527/g.89388  ORF Transcript_23527/g.89388 Transcript_23527/m.89388 type:complete len:207 (-) Transcript_23527:400-1020(-)